VKNRVRLSLKKEEGPERNLPQKPGRLGKVCSRQPGHRQAGDGGAVMCPPKWESKTGGTGWGHVTGALDCQAKAGSSIWQPGKWEKPNILERNRSCCDSTHQKQMNAVSPGGHPEHQGRHIRWPEQSDTSLSLASIPLQDFSFPRVN
jgi:hypothetical protein